MTTSRPRWVLHAGRLVRMGRLSLASPPGRFRAGTGTRGGAEAATGRTAMVVTDQHIAAEVGRDVLAAGGNAIDAAVAMGYALAVVEPCCGNLGGSGFMLIYLADGRDRFINFRERAPLKATPACISTEAAMLLPAAARAATWRWPCQAQWLAWRRRARAMARVHAPR